MVAPRARVEHGVPVRINHAWRNVPTQHARGKWVCRNYAWRKCVCVALVFGLGLHEDDQRRCQTLPIQDCA
jgi:hypothetical protein